MFDVESFIQVHWLSVSVFIVSILPIVKPGWVGQQATYFNQQTNREVPALRQSILAVLLFNLSDAIIRTFQPLIVSLQLRGTMTLLIFVALGTDLYFRHQLSAEAVSVVLVGLIALYFEGMLATAKKIQLWVLRWESK